MEFNRFLNARYNLQTSRDEFFFINTQLMIQGEQGLRNRTEARIGQSTEVRIEGRIT